MLEIWKDIEGYSGQYQISNKGNVKSFKRNQKGVNLKPQISGQGYLAVSLLTEGKAKWHKVHRLVALAFLENPENKQEVNHLDGDKTNNCVENLVWANRSENTKHAYDAGLNPGTAKPIQVYSLADEYLYTLLGEKQIIQQGFIPSNVYACARGKRKTHKGHKFIKQELEIQ